MFEESPKANIKRVCGSQCGCVCVEPKYKTCGSQCGLPAAAVDRDTWQPSSTSNPKHLKPLFLTFSFLSAFNVTKQLVKSGNIIHTLRLSDRTFDFNTLCDPDPHPSDKASVLHRWVSI